MKTWTLSSLVGNVVIVSALIIAAVHLIHRARRDSLIRECASNQNMLIKAAYNYCCNGKRTLPFPPMGGSGGEALLKIHRFEEFDEPRLLHCPFRGDGVAGTTHYRGPIGDLSRAGATHFFACDQTENHPSGVPLNGVLKSGDAVRIERGSAEFDRAMKETQP